MHYPRSGDENGNPRLGDTIVYHPWRRQKCGTLEMYKDQRESKKYVRRFGVTDGYAPETGEWRGQTQDFRGGDKEIYHSGQFRKLVEYRLTRISVEARNFCGRSELHTEMLYVT